MSSQFGCDLDISLRVNILLAGVVLAGVSKPRLVTRIEVREKRMYRDEQSNLPDSK